MGIINLTSSNGMVWCGSLKYIDLKGGGTCGGGTMLSSGTAAPSSGSDNENSLNNYKYPVTDEHGDEEDPYFIGEVSGFKIHEPFPISKLSIIYLSSYKQNLNGYTFPTAIF